MTAPPRPPKTKQVSDLQVGDRFSWIPAEWYGPCRLISKRQMNGDGSDLWDLKFEAKVVNPPGVVYGMKGTTRVRMLAPVSPHQYGGKPRRAHVAN